MGSPADSEGDFEFSLDLEGRLTIIMTRATDPAGNVGDVRAGIR